MKLKFDQIYNKDCVAGLAQLEAGSVDLAFADPPFNIGYDYDIYNDRRAADEYIGWSKQWISGVIKALKPTGTFWLAIGDEYAAELKVLCTRDLGLHCRSWVVWFYTFGVHCRTKFTRSHAHLFHFVKDPKMFTFNLGEVRVPSARELVYGDKRAHPAGRSPDDTWMIPPTLPDDAATKDGFVLRPQDIPDRFPPHSDTWYFARVAGTFGERRGWHGCQMPEQLLGRIIRACSNEGDRVLDPFGGSGTTLAVAKKLKREFIGFELSLEYVRKIRERLSAIQAGESLVGPENAATSAPRTSAGRRLKRPSDLLSEPISTSPIITKTNASLGQVAVANGELGTAVAEAFMAAHQGYSADRVLADPELNNRFLGGCKLLGIPGSPKDWNHLLLNLRKQGKLGAIDTSRRTTVHRSAMDDFIFASEIAWRKLSEERGCTLDEILCDPELVLKFDVYARRIAPGHSAFDYRWAALAVRKEASKGASRLHAVNGALARKSVQLSELGELAIGPAHYLVNVRDTPFFVGFSNALRGCKLFTPESIASAAEVMGQRVKRDSDVTILSRAFDFSAIKKATEDGQEVEWRAARRARLLQRFAPMANIPLHAS